MEHSPRFENWEVLVREEMVCLVVVTVVRLKDAQQKCLHCSLHNLLQGVSEKNSVHSMGVPVVWIFSRTAQCDIVLTCNIHVHVRGFVWVRK